MKFSDKEIEIAKELHEFDLPWQPQTGNYVFDINGIIEKPSPFQYGVYYILDIKHFLRRAENIQGIKNSMCWLPIWEECRQILNNLLVPWTEIFQRLEGNSSFEKGIERTVLYEIMLEKIKKNVYH